MPSFDQPQRPVNYFAHTIVHGRLITTPSGPRCATYAPIAVCGSGHKVLWSWSLVTDVRHWTATNRCKSISPSPVANLISLPVIPPSYPIVTSRFVSISSSCPVLLFPRIQARMVLEQSLQSTSRLRNSKSPQSTRVAKLYNVLPVLLESLQIASRRCLASLPLSFSAPILLLCCLLHAQRHGNQPIQRLARGRCLRAMQQERDLSQYVLCDRSLAR
jgi:hypothetical protein